MQTDNKETGDGSRFSNFRLPDKKTIFSTLYYGWKNLRIGISGIWLFSLYIVLGLLVVFSLGAHQLQYAIKSTVIAGKTPLAIWQVLEVHTEWVALKDKMQHRKILVDQYQSSLKDQNAKWVSLNTDFAMAKGNCESRVTELVHFLSTKDAIGPKDRKVKYTCTVEDLAKLTDAKNLHIEGSDGELSEETNRDIEIYVKDVIESINASKRVKIALDEVASTKISIVDSETKLVTSNETDRKELKKILNEEDFGLSMGDFLNSLSYFENKSNIPLVPNFAKIPPDVLTLILVLSMGALGGTISLTRLYLDQGEGDDKATVGATTFLFKPLLGAISALAVFILAKAGVLIVSNPAPGGGASLSPFFVSFVGIVSGLLADQALETIRKTGNKWFEQAEVLEIPRWAYGLAALLGKPAGDEAELDKKVAQYLANQAELAKTLDVSPQKIQSWIKEDTAVSLREQELIAVYFRRSARYIFSDIKGD